MTLEEYRKRENQETFNKKYTMFSSYHLAAKKLAGGDMAVYGRLMYILNSLGIENEIPDDITEQESAFLDSHIENILSSLDIAERNRQKQQKSVESRKQSTDTEEQFFGNQSANCTANCTANCEKEKELEYEFEKEKEKASKSPNSFFYKKNKKENTNFVNSKTFLTVPIFDKDFERLKKNPKQRCDICNTKLVACPDKPLTSRYCSTCRDNYELKKVNGSYAWVSLNQEEKNNNAKNLIKVASG